MAKAININNPSKRELRIIKNIQQYEWETVNAKTKWDAKDFESALNSGMIWSDEFKEWIYHVAHLERLAFDVRTPQLMARKLAEWLKVGSGKSK